MARIPDSVEDAIRAELESLSSIDAVLAATALELARQIDAPRTSPTAKSMCARELRETMTRLRDLAPEDHEETPLDEIRARRDARLAGQPAAADPVDTRRGSAAPGH